MPFIQRAEANDFTGTGADPISTPPFASEVEAGSLIIVAVFHYGAARILTITDTLGNTYFEIGSVLTNGSDRLRLYYAISQAAGANAVSADSADGPLAYWGIAAEEWSGIAAPGTLVGEGGQVQATPTTALNAATSTATAPSAQPCLQWALSVNAALTGGAPAAGTGFAGGAPFWGNFARSESAQRTNLDSVAATFTASINDTHLTRQAFFREASSMVTITSAGDASFRVGETGIGIVGTNFGASQGAGFVRVCPSNDVNDANGVNMTITTWGNTGITFDFPATLAAAFPRNTNVYLFVRNDAGQSNATGYVVQITPPPAVLAFHLLH